MTSQFPTNDLVLGEERNAWIPLHPAGELYATICAVDFGLEKKEPEKTPTVVFDEAFDRRFDTLLVCSLLTALTYINNKYRTKWG